MDWNIHHLRHMQKRRLPYLNKNPLYLLGEKYGLDFFGEVDRRILQNCYYNDIILCRKVLHQLAFYGAVFKGGLESYSILQHPAESLYLWKTCPRAQLFQPAIPFHVLQKVKEFGILYEQDAVGLPLLSFARYQDAFPFEKVFKESGFELISLPELLLRLGISPSMAEDKEPAEPLQGGENANTDAAGKAKVMDGSWAQVLDDLERLTKQTGGRGIKSTRQVLEEFKVLREKLEVSQRNKPPDEGVPTVAGIPETGLKSRLEFFMSCVDKIARDKNAKNAQRVSLILESKYGMLSERKHPTLKDVGRILGITRERVRQILTRFWQKELAKYNFPVPDLLNDVSRLGGLIPVRNFMPAFSSLNSFEQFTLNEVFNIFGLAVMEPGIFLTSLTKGEYETIQNQLADELQAIGDFPLYPAAIEQTVKDFVQKRGFHAACVSAFLRVVFEHLLATWGDGYILKDLFKSEKIVSLLKEYPEGLAVHRDFDSFFARLDSVFPGEFHEHDRYIYASIVNSQKALLWGWGIYIHRDHVQITKADLAEIVVWLHGQFAAGVEKLSAYAAFHEFHEYLLARGVPNEHALYGCLRHFYGPEFYMPKTPYVYPAYVHESKQNTEILGEFIRNRGHNTAYGELQAEFVERRGWKEYTLQQTITLSPQIIRTARSEYGLKEFYPAVTAESMEPLAEFLEASLSMQNQQVNIRLLYMQKQAACNRLGIESDIALYSLMEKHFSGRFSFPQYPHVRGKFSDTGAETSNVRLLDDYLKNLGKAIGRGELKKEFISRRFWTDKALENALRANPQIFTLQYGSAAEYVHADVLGWSKEKQAELEGWVQKRLAEVRTGSVPYGNVQRDLFRPEQLLRLDSGFSWTVDLFMDRLKDCTFIKFIGTARELFVPLPNNFGIHDDLTFLAYVLRTEFQGSADIALLQKRLAELGFSRDRKIRAAYKRADRNLPYVFTDGKIVLREQREGNGA